MMKGEKETVGGDGGCLRLLYCRCAGRQEKAKLESLGTSE